MKKLIIAVLGATLALGSSWSLNALADKPGSHSEKPLPKGLQKKLARGGQLPPGWQKKLHVGEVLPADLRVSAEPVSREIADAVAASDRVAAEILRIEDKIVRVSKGEGTVIDVIDLADVLAGRGMRPAKQ